MKAAMIFSGSGPLVILTSYGSLKNPSLLERFKAKGISKFLAYEIPVALAKERYGGHFQAVLHNLHESDDLRILDYNGHRAFELFSFGEPVELITHEA